MDWANYISRLCGFVDSIMLRFSTALPGGITIFNKQPTLPATLP